MVVAFFYFSKGNYSSVILNNNSAPKFLKFKMYLGICFLVVGDKPNELSFWCGSWGGAVLVYWGGNPNTKVSSGWCKKETPLVKL